MKKVDVLVVGLGPVGLYVSYILAQKGVNVATTDKRESYFEESRSIGIHPPLLHLLDSQNLLKDFHIKGLKVNQIKIFFNKRELSDVNLSCIKSTHPYVLFIPQYETERILFENLTSLPSADIYKGEELIQLSQDDSKVIAHFRSGMQIEAKFIIGADGIHSTLRKLLQISYDGSYFNDYYAMADFFDDRNSQEVRLYLSKLGLLESFPLPNKKRRWVARIDQKDFSQSLELSFLEKIVLERKCEDMHLGNALSSLRLFKTGYFESKHFYHNRAILLGDAAHMLSPIGGQGMNLGWLGAHNICTKLLHCLFKHERYLTEFKKYELEQKNLARIINKRAQFNMSFGRDSLTLPLRSIILASVLRSKFKTSFIERFVMEKLPSFQHAAQSNNSS